VECHSQTGFKSSAGISGHIMMVNPCLKQVE